MATSITWVGGTTGSWFTGGNWQTDTNPPAGGPPDSTENATVTGTSSALITVTFDQALNGSALSLGMFDATLNQSVGTLTLLDGSSLDDLVQSGGLLDFQNAGGAASYIAGGIDQTAGTIEVDSGALVANGTIDLTGTISGNGNFVIGGGANATIEAGAVFTVGTLELGVNGDGFPSYTTLDTDLTYSGLFLLDDYSGNHAELDLNGHTLTLDGGATLDGFVDGPGTLALNGTVTVGSSGYGSLIVQDGADVIVNGTVTESDNGSSIGAGLTINSGGIWDFTVDAGIDNNASAAIDNLGLIEKTGGTGTSEIHGSFADSGTVDVTTGTIYVSGSGGTLTGTIEGAGAFSIGGGGTYTLASGLVLTVGTLGFYDAGTDIVLTSDITYTGALNGFVQFGTLTVDLGDHTLKVTDALSFSSAYGALDITDGGTLLIAQGAQGTLDQVSFAGGVTLENAGTLDLTGIITLDSDGASGTSTVLNDAAGTIFLDASGTDIGNGGTAALVTNKGLIENTGSYTAEIDAAVNNTGTIEAVTGSDVALYAGGTIGGTLTGAGEIDLRGGGTYHLSSDVVLNVGTLGFYDGGTDIVLASDITYGGVLNGYVQFSTLTVNLGGTTFTVSDTANLSSSYGSLNVTGGGTLKIAGGATATLAEIAFANGTTLENAGTVTINYAVDLDFDNGASVSTLQNDATGTIILNTSGTNIGTGGTAALLTNAGLIENTGSYTADIYAAVNNTGTIDAATGADVALHGGGTLGGTLTGGGEIDLRGGGTYDLSSDLVLNVGTLGIYDGATDVVLGSDLTYGGTFSQGGGTVDLSGYDLTLNGAATVSNSTIIGPGTGTGTLTMSGTVSVLSSTISGIGTVKLSGTATLGNSTFNGPGTLDLSNQATIYNFYVGDGLSVDITGTVDQAGYVQYGAASTDTIQVTIESRGTYDLTTNDWVNNPNSNDDGTATITNEGLFEKTAGTGTSTIFADMDNTGTILVDSGTLDFESIGTSTLGGTITGSGELVLGRNAYLIDTALFNVSTLYVGANGVTLEEDLSYAGAFTQGSGVIYLGGYDLTLSNTATLENSTITGAGTLALTNDATLANFYVGTGGAVDITGTVDQAGYVQYGTTSTDSIQITIGSSGVYDLTTNDWVDNPNSNDNGEATFTNDGLVEKTVGTGTSTFYTGFVNNGTVQVDTGTLHLAQALTGTGALAMETGTALELGGSVSAGQTISFAGTNTLYLDDASAMSGTITGFAAGDTIDLTNVNYDSAGTADLDPSTHILTVTENSVSYTFHMAGDYTGLYFHLEPDGTAIIVNTTPCFLPGTRIRTDKGEVAVEALTVGDTVVTLSGAKRRLCWIGKGHALATRGRRGPATPIIVRKGALADNVPYADLRITKGHSLYLDGVLIPAEYLVNHHSICWDDRAQDVTVFHLELDTHDVLVANGAAAESYRDDGNRWLFQNANSGWDQPGKPPCAPVLTGGAIVDAIWRRLLDRAAPRMAPLTDEPDLHLLVDGVRRKPAMRRGAMVVFTLADRPGDVRIVSRAAAPQELGLARDPRSLGVALRRITLLASGRLTAIAADDAALADGFHAFEPDNDFRWTDGDARVPAALFDGMAGPARLELMLGGTARYLDDGDDQARAAAA
jgi:hypothetical protein